MIEIKIEVTCGKCGTVMNEFKQYHFGCPECLNEVFVYPDIKRVPKTI